MPKITKRLVDSMKPDAERESFAWDSELRGFGVRVMPTGVGSYILKYRNVDGRQRKIALARIGAVTPDEARHLARKQLAEIVNGADPSASRKVRRAAMSVSELCDLYLDDSKERIKASTWAMNRSRITVHVKPLIGTRSVLTLSSDDVERMQADIAAGKTARPRSGRGGSTTGGKGVASRTAGMLGTILEFARRKKIVKASSLNSDLLYRRGRDLIHRGRRCCHGEDAVDGFAQPGCCIGSCWGVAARGGITVWGECKFRGQVA